MIPSEIDFPGEVASAELVADRRGSRIWKVVLQDGQVLALKYATDNAETHGVQGSASQLAAREASVLRVIGDPGYLHSAGATAAGSWLAVKWIDAPTLAKRWSMLREDPSDPAARIAAVVSAWLSSEVLRRLHDAGWRHADLQGAHILVPDEGSAGLIDFALAQAPSNVVVEPDIPYRGALAHLTAPEIAAEIIRTPDSHHIALTFAAEVYALGAVLFAAWARQWPCDYRREPRELDLFDIYVRITDPDSRRPQPDGWPRMAGLIESMLEPDPAKRPTMVEVHADLGQMAGGRT